MTLSSHQLSLQRTMRDMSSLCNLRGGERERGKKEKNKLSTPCRVQLSRAKQRRRRENPLPFFFFFFFFRLLGRRRSERDARARETRARGTRVPPFPTHVHIPTGDRRTIGHPVPSPASLPIRASNSCCRVRAHFSRLAFTGRRDGEPKKKQENKKSRLRGRYACASQARR